MLYPFKRNRVAKSGNTALVNELLALERHNPSLDSEHEVLHNRIHCTGLEV